MTDEEIERAYDAFDKARGEGKTDYQAFKAVLSALNLGANLGADVPPGVIGIPITEQDQ
jgi:hypothetical protein